MTDAQFNGKLSIALVVVFWAMFHIAFLYAPVFLSGGCISFDEIWFHQGDHMTSPWWGVFTVQLLFLMWITCQLYTNWHFKKDRMVWLAAVLLPCITIYGLLELKQFADFQSSGKSAHMIIEKMGPKKWMPSVMHVNSEIQHLQDIVRKMTFVRTKHSV